MRIKAYILAADPAWIEASVLSYYPVVEEIVVSYDGEGVGWTGAPVAVPECLRRLRAIDPAGKLRYCPGSYARLDFLPMENETHQRRCAIDAVGADVDWVLQLDTDEVLPDPRMLLEALQHAQRMGAMAVEWPMRVLFQRLRDGRFLEVCDHDRMDRFEYPGPIAVRPGVVLDYARRTKQSTLRVVVAGDDRSLEVRRPPEANERRCEIAAASGAIIHNSWARPAPSIRSKIASWGHHQGLKTRLYYYTRWAPAPYIWSRMRDFHPFSRGLWPALKPCEALSADLLRVAR